VNKARLISGLLLAGLLLCSCSGAVKVKADISAYGDTPVTISGLLDEDFTITPDELAGLECVQMNGSGKSEKAGTVSAVGPLLETFLARYGKSKTDFAKIRFYASDNYKITLREESLTKYKIVLSVARGNDPLPAAQQPLRLFLPKAESSNWIYAVIRIEFIAKEE
jgi:hypothetical protein